VDDEVDEAAARDSDHEMRDTPADDAEDVVQRRRAKVTRRIADEDDEDEDEEARAASTGPVHENQDDDDDDVLFGESPRGEDMEIKEDDEE
jgi:RNA polymerase-associated protein CTR9